MGHPRDYLGWNREADMLKPDLITREELYEAVWTESVQSLAKALGISDVGLAKICKKLNVPRPGRGYWAKASAARKVLKKPLPPLSEDQAESYRVSLDATQGGSAWSREALQHLAEEGVKIPTFSLDVGSTGVHPLIETYRGTIERAGTKVKELIAEKACLAVIVSPAQLDRSMDLLQRIFAGFEEQGYHPEVLPPDPRGQNQYGYSQSMPSRTGVRIKNVFVAFQLMEAIETLEVPAPVQPTRTTRANVYAPPPRPTYEQVGTGRLILEILDPAPHGMRKRWQDSGTKTIEKGLDSFFRAVMAIAEHQNEKEQEWERQRNEEEEAKRRKQEAETRRAELEARRHDLESRMLDLQEAEALRHFIQMIREDADRRGVDLEVDEEIRGWVAWVEGLAGDLERKAIQTLKQRRHRTKEPSTAGYRPPDETETRLRGEVDLWRRRYIYGRR
jgi:hypothetical protein